MMGDHREDTVTEEETLYRDTFRDYNIKCDGKVR